MKIGFVGQGWIGKNYADNYESRGYSTVRYSKDIEYKDNFINVQKCDIIFLAVPTPTKNGNYDLSIVESILAEINTGPTIVIKSTLLPGKTKELQNKFPKHFIFHSPEFLSERTVRQDVDNPHANIIGTPNKSEEYLKRSKQVLDTFPVSQYNRVMDSTEAELIKYSRNIHGFYEIIFYNLFYDLSQKLNINYEVLKDYFKHDPLHVARYASPVHDSGHTLGKFGRGAGGHCFIKDFKAFKDFGEQILQDENYKKIFESLENKNIELLTNSQKDMDILEEVYGTNK